MESVFDLFKMLMGECRWDLQGDDPGWPWFDPGQQVDRQLELIKNLGRDTGYSRNVKIGPTLYIRRSAHNFKGGHNFGKSKRVQVFHPLSLVWVVSLLFVVDLSITTESIIDTHNFL
jgi:hypothetical protein